ncbi:hypothetical protein [Orrella sp. 11846]|uniref:hypothetical protein n=1 Tax=Orrella sp. 11846 TaxID=3409913 RepID=UPI003B5A8A43
MLEELDQLEQRIRVLAQQVQAVRDERDALRRQVTVLSNERDGLIKNLSDVDAELGQLRQKATVAQVQASQEMLAAKEEVTRIQGTLDIFVAEKSALTSDLQNKTQEVQRLREVASQAQTRINHVLERLPGAIAQE